MRPQRPAPLRVVPLLALALFASLPTPAHGHGLLADPAQRGAHCSAMSNSGHPYVPDEGQHYPDSLCDMHTHFPSGDKSLVPGAALRSQIAFAREWTPFEPFKRNFQWRAGVCGDLRRRNGGDPPQEHMRGGKYYYGGHITRTYTEGSTVSFHTSIIAHHNGFLEFHLCDVRRCGGEISEACFQKGACFQLQRAFDPDCQSGQSQDCGPIDRRYPGRWYLPCRRRQLMQRQGNTFNYYGGRAMRYRLPRGFRCEHCVLHWYWVAANTCNPPGVLEYFNGPDRPRRWGRCRGQGGARGGAAREQGACRRRRFPEEYYTCADIRIVAPGQSTLPIRSRAVFSHLTLVKRGPDGQPVAVRNMRHRSFHRFRFRRTDQIDFRASVLRRPVFNGVKFYSRSWRRGIKGPPFFQRNDRRRPFYMSGDTEGQRLRYWKRAFSRSRFEIIARAAGQEISVVVEFIVS